MLYTILTYYTISDKNMTTNIKEIEDKSNVASNTTLAIERANALLKTEIKARQALKTRKKQDVSNQIYDITSTVFKKRASYLTRDYMKVVSQKDNEIVIDTKTDLSKDMCMHLNLDYAVTRYNTTNKNYFISSSQFIKASRNRGSAYGDNNRASCFALVAMKAFVHSTKDEMIANNLAVDLSKHYFKLNLQSAIVKTRIAQLKTQETVKVTV